MNRSKRSERRTAETPAANRSGALAERRTICLLSPVSLKKLGSAAAPGAAADALVRRREQRSASIETVSSCIRSQPGGPASFCILHSSFPRCATLNSPRQPAQRGGRIAPRRSISDLQYSASLFEFLLSQFLLFLINPRCLWKGKPTQFMN